MTKKLLTALALVLSARAAGAADRIAVLEFAGANISPDILRAVSDRTRGAALEPARRIGYEMMTRESTALVIEQMGGQCLEGQCEIEIARSVGAAMVITGDVRKLEGTFFVDLKLHDTGKGSLVAVESFRGSDLLAMFDAAPDATVRLCAVGFERFFGKPVGREAQFVVVRSAAVLP